MYTPRRAYASQVGRSLKGNRTGFEKRLKWNCKITIPSHGLGHWTHLLDKEAKKLNIHARGWRSIGVHLFNTDQDLFICCSRLDLHFKRIRKRFPVAPANALNSSSGASPLHQYVESLESLLTPPLARWQPIWGFETFKKNALQILKNVRSPAPVPVNLV